MGRKDVLTEAPADRRVFFRHLCACAGRAGVGGAAPYLFQMNYRGLLSYNGFFVSKVPSWLWILVMGDKVLYLGNKQQKKRCKPNSWCLFFPLFCLWLQIHWTALWIGKKKFYCIDCYCFWWKLSCKITFGLSPCWIKVTSCLWLLSIVLLSFLKMPRFR